MVGWVKGVALQLADSRLAGPALVIDDMVGYVAG